MQKILSRSLSSRSSRVPRGTADHSLVVAVVCPPGHNALKFMPKKTIEEAKIKFVVANDTKTFLSSPDLENFEALLWVPPGDVKVLSGIWPHVKSNVKWVHSFFAGVDGLSGFITEHLNKPKLSAGTSSTPSSTFDLPNVPLTNGRGAFSSSLAEYAIAAILHFNKQVPRIQSNSKNGRWDKFIMDTVKGKTLGLIGFGHIAKAVAAVARPLGMNVVALRRDPKKGNDDNLADEV